MEKKHNNINVEEVKKNIRKLQVIDKKLIPQYLDDIRSKNKIKPQQVNKDDRQLKYMI